jgi:hypothetical protein
MISGGVVRQNPMRGSRLLILLVAGAVAVAGCTSKPERAAPTARDDAPQEQAKSEIEKRAATPRNYDAEGRLLPSDDYIVGIRLPRGTELFREDKGLHVYRIREPIDKVLAYFGPMMITGNVERRGKGAVYKRASVRGAEVNPTKVDVSILELDRAFTRISVTEYPPSPKYVPPAGKTKAAATETFRTLD